MSVAASNTSVLDILSEAEFLHAELASRELRFFVRYAWPTVEPKAKYKENWHIAAICEHLQAISNGEIKNLLINIPPRCMKSLIVSVLWPAWDWIHTPERRWLTSSYAEQLAVRDSVKTRRVITSEWYQRHWGLASGHPTAFKLTGDVNAKSRYENDKTGYRIATSVRGGATGEGGDYVIVDDPHNVIEAESDAVREKTLVWWDETMSSRLDDQAAGGKIIVMQRTHENDLSGHVLDKGNYTHLMLPMEFDPERKCVTQIGFEDPRSEENELLWEDRFPQDVIDDMKIDLGDYAWATQYDQNPAQREGAMFKINSFVIIDPQEHPYLLDPNGEVEVNGKMRRVYVEVWRAWDKAGTEGSGAYTAGAKIGVRKDPKEVLPHLPRFIVFDCTRGQWATNVREMVMRDVAETDGKSVKISLEQEPGSGGKESAESSIDNLAGFYVKADTVSTQGNKEKRADPFSVQVNAGNVGLIDQPTTHYEIRKGQLDKKRKPWIKDYKAEFRTFPNSKFKDQVDASSQAFARVARPVRVHV